MDGAQGYLVSAVLLMKGGRSVGESKQFGPIVRNLTCLAAAAAFFLCSSTPALAASEPEIGGVVTDDEISVSVPTSISCTMMADGTVVAPSGLAVVNRGKEAIVMDAFTQDAMGHSIGYSLDAEGSRVLTRRDGADTAKPNGTDISAGASCRLTLSVDALNRAQNGALMDSAVQKATNLFELGFKFNVKALREYVKVSKGSDGVFHAQAVGLQDGAVAAYQWYIKGEGAINGAVSPDYRPAKTDDGKTLYCKVTDSSGKYSGELVSNEVVYRVDKLNAKVTASVEGNKVVATVTGAPSDAKLHYQWFRKGQKQDVVTRSWDLGPWENGNVTVPVRGDEVTVLLEQKDNKPLMRSVFLSATADGVSGQVYYGEAYQIAGVPTTIQLPSGISTLYFHLANGDVNAHSYSLTIQCPYQVDESIPGATERVYTPVADDKGMRLYCKVTDSSGKYVGELVSNEVASPASLSAGEIQMEGDVDVA